MLKKHILGFLVLTLIFLVSCNQTNENKVLTETNTETNIETKAETNIESETEIKPKEVKIRNSYYRFQKFYDYIYENLNLDGYKFIEGSGGKDAKFHLAIVPDATFNHKKVRTDSQGNSVVQYLEYKLDNDDYKSKITIEIYNNEENFEKYTFTSFGFHPKSLDESFETYILKYKDYILRISQIYEDSKLKNNDVERFKKEISILSGNVKKLIDLLNKYEQ